MEAYRIYRGKQAWAASIEKRPQYKYHNWYGSVRSGKTEPGLFGFMDWSRQYKNTLFLLTEPTVAQLHNILIPYIDTYTNNTAKYGYKHFSFDDNKYLMFSANDEGAQAKIKGLTLQGAFNDETTEIPESYFDQTIARCSLPGAKIVSITNPAGTNHWFKKRFVDNDENDNLQFGLEDNPSLSREYKEDLLKQWTGAFLQRNYYGEWFDAAGAIYPNYTRGDPPPYKDAHRHFLACDSARSGTTHVLLITEYVSPNQIWIVDEWVHNGAKQGVLTWDEQATRIKRELVGDIPLTIAYGDPSGSDFLNALSKVLDCPVQGGMNDVLPGIQQTATWLESGYLRISNKVQHLLAEITEYSLG